MVHKSVIKKAIIFQIFAFLQKEINTSISDQFYEVSVYTIYI